MVKKNIYKQKTDKTRNMSGNASNEGRATTRVTQETSYISALRPELILDVRYARTY